jgi:predicted outer membrane repeat protein
MKFKFFLYLCLGAMFVFTGSILVKGTSAAPLFDSTFYVTNDNDAGPGSLREAILVANANVGADLIAIQVDGTVFLESPLPLVAEDLRIEADGYTFAIDGSSQYRIFEVPAGVRLELSGLELISGTGNLGNGGAVWNAGMLDVQSCTFLANFAELGGAIYNEGSVHLRAGTEILQSNAVQGAGIYNLGELNVEDTIFYGNVAPLEGGAIYNEGTVTVLRGEFSDGFGMDGAGIYSKGGVVTVEDSTFSGLETNSTGGAISISGDLIVHSTWFFGNQSVQGGALYVNAGGSAEIEGGSFEQNQSATGGAIMNAGTLTITNSTLTGNRAEGNGGAITNSGTLSVNNTNLTGNTSVGDGGGIHNSDTGEVLLEAVGIEENEARAGGALNNAGNLEAYASSFAFNHADWGGGIQNTGSMFLQTGQVNDNLSGSEGGGLYNTGLLTLDEVLMRGNRATDGGGLLNQGEVEIHGGRFEGNNAHFDFGGGIFNLSQGSLQIYTTVFEGNSVSNGGGAIFSSGILVIQDASFNGNGAKWGGAIHHWSAQTAVIEGTSFSNNYAGHWGGAIINDGNMELENCTFTNNISEDFSGALHNNGDLIVREAVFSGNNVRNGSGGAVENWQTALFENSTFENNRSYSRGGAIFAGQAPAELILRKVTLSQNEAPEGGAIYSQGVLFIENSTLSANRASEGSAILSYGTTTLNYITIFGNLMLENNQGAAVQNYGSFSLANSIVSGTSGGKNCLGDIFQVGFNLSDDDTCPGYNITDPILGPLQNNGGPTYTHALLWGSPVVDAAAGDCPATDQRGVARPVGPACDLGAYEAVQTIIAIDIRPKTTNNGIDLQSTGSLPVAILSAPGFSAPTQVDRSTLFFGVTGWENPPLTSSLSGKLLCNVIDANADGKADLVCTFPITGTNFTCSSQQGILRGKLKNGDWFVGTDLIKPLYCP